MTLALLHEALIAGLASHMRGWGFVKSTRSFRRRDGDRQWSLHLAFINHVNDFDVVADVAVEHLLNKQRICIVGAELGNIIGTGQRRWSVGDLPHAQAAADGVHQLFITAGVPFLQRFSELSQILNTLRADQKTARLICPFVKDHVAEADAIESRAKQQC
jgi:hypothetical protein